MCKHILTNCEIIVVSNFSRLREMDGFVARLADDTALLEAKLVPIPAYTALRHELPPIPRLPDDRESQEAYILYDLISLLRGSEGAYIHFDNDSGGFEPNSLLGRMRGPGLRVPRAVDSALRDVADEIAETARHHMAVIAFAEYLSTPNQGRVNHALSAALMALSHNFNELVASIDRETRQTGETSLHALLLCLIPARKVMEQAYRLTRELLSGSNGTETITGNGLERIGLRGGAVLTLLARRLERHKGNPAARELYQDLIKESSKPYLQMLTQWLYKGIIDDPYEEFMVEEQETIASDLVHRDSLNSYWEKRYVIRENCLPLYLSSPEIAEQVLQAGKYLNVIQECGGERIADWLPKANIPVFTSIEDAGLALAVSQAYQRANQTLLRLLIYDQDLLSRLVSLKHYYFFDRNDAFPLFLETAAKELARPVQDVSTRRLQYSLDMALAQPGSSSSQEVYADEVQIEMADDSITDALLRVVQVRGDRDFDELMESSVSVGNEVELTALESIVVDFDIPFPQSLVVSRPAILCYQFLFRHLLRIKVTEQTLNGSWIKVSRHSIWRRHSENEEFEQWKWRALELRSKMVTFVEQLLYYCTADVVERNSTEFFSEINDALTVDSLKTNHINYLDRCLTECMLTTPEFLVPQRDLLKTACRFGEWLIEQTPQLGLIDASNLTRQEKSHVIPQLTSDGFLSGSDYLEKVENDLEYFSLQFSQSLEPFFETLNIAAYDSGALRSLLARLESLVDSP